MKISIAMATYNGARYLREQLESFSAQSILPDELVICDDGSTDGTLDIARDFAESSRFPVRIFINEVRLNYARNFGRAIEYCSGDLIFLSDQDDVWFPEKIKRVRQYFLESASTWVVVNDAEITDAVLNTSGRTTAGQLVSSGGSTDLLLLGCCLAFRAQLKPLLFPIPHEIHGHDGWVNTLGIALGVRKFLPEVLQYYRRHQSNVSEWERTSTRREKSWRVEKMKWSRDSRKIDPVVASNDRLFRARVLKDRLVKHESYFKSFFPGERAIHEVVFKLNAECEINEARKAIQMSKGWKRIWMAFGFYKAGKYKKFEGWKSFLKDIAW